MTIQVNEESTATSLEPRPGTVVTAAALQAAAVLLLLAVVPVAWFAREQFDGFADEAARLVRAEPGELAAEHSSNLVMAIAVSALAGLPALWLGATLWPMLRRSNVARILAAVAAFGIPGLGLLMVLGSCLTGFLFIGLFAAVPFEEDPGVYGDGDFDIPEDTPFQQKLWDLQGSGPTLGDVMPLIILVVMGLLTAVAVLLVVPSTRRWFSPQRSIPAGRPYPVYYPVYVPAPGAYSPPYAPGPPAYVPFLPQPTQPSGHPAVPPTAAAPPPITDLDEQS